MNLYHFFTKDIYGEQTYGSEYFVLSDSLENAKHYIVDCVGYKESVRYGCASIESMGYGIYGVGEVVCSEIS